MLKKLIITAIILTGFVFFVSGGQSEIPECKLDNSQECWQFDHEIGWIYHAPIIEVSADVNQEDWSYDE